MTTRDDGGPAPEPQPLTVEPAYYAKDGVVWKSPVRTQKPDGSCSISIGFAVCTMRPEVGPEAAATVAAMLCAAEALDRERAANAAMREPVPDTYACQRCGRRDGLDCVLPSHLWNQIESETGHSILCTWCIDAECAKRGWEVPALLYLVGRAIHSGGEPGPHWERHLQDLTARCSNAESANAAMREALEAADDWFTKSEMGGGDDGVNFLNDGGWEEGEVAAAKVKAALAGGKAA